jgi:hypothetical protein
LIAVLSVARFARCEDRGREETKIRDRARNVEQAREAQRFPLSAASVSATR